MPLHKSLPPRSCPIKINAVMCVVCAQLLALKVKIIYVDKVSSLVL